MFQFTLTSKLYLKRYGKIQNLWVIKLLWQSKKFHLPSAESGGTLLTLGYWDSYTRNIAPQQEIGRPLKFLFVLLTWVLFLPHQPEHVKGEQYEWLRRQPLSAVLSTLASHHSTAGCFNGEVMTGRRWGALGADGDTVSPRWSPGEYSKHHPTLMKLSVSPWEICRRGFPFNPPAGTRAISRQVRNFDDR